MLWEGSPPSGGAEGVRVHTTKIRLLLEGCVRTHVNVSAQQGVERREREEGGPGGGGGLGVSRLETPPEGPSGP